MDVDVADGRERVADAVAVVVAVKGLGRYPELRSYPAGSERFVVGTLASLTWAAGVGFLGRWLLLR